MSLAGPDALRALEEAVRDIRREEDEIAKRSARSAELLIKLRAQEAELYRLLGETRLDADGRQVQARLIADINNRVETTISHYDAGFADAEATVHHAEADLARGNAERSALQAEASRRDEELSSHVAMVRPRLGTDAGYASKLAAARDLAAMAEASVGKAARADAARTEKLAAFRSDPLFSYLSDRFYGTPQYASRGVFAALDAWVARLIAYDKSAGIYGAINELPRRLREHAEQLQERARAAAADVASMESIAIDSAGGRTAREAIEALAPRIEALDLEHVVLQDRRDAAILARSELAHGGQLHATALGELEELLEQPPLRPLLAEARLDPGEAETSVLGQVDDLIQRLKDETAEAEEYAEQLRILSGRRRDLEDIQYEIRLRGLDNPHVRFADDRLVQERLNEFLRGGLTAAAYWDQWRQSQSWDRAGYGGPGGGWGRLPLSSSGKGLSRPRASRPAQRLTSAA